MTGIDCPTPLYSFSQCSLSTAPDINCPNHAQDTAIQCYDDGRHSDKNVVTDVCILSFTDNPFSCFSASQFFRPHASGLLSTREYYESGYASLCINRTQTLLCSDSLSTAQAELVCRDIRSTFTVAMVLDSQMDFRPPIRRYGAYDIACSAGQVAFDPINGCNATVVTDGCSSQGGAALITCIEGMLTYLTICIILQHPAVCYRCWRTLPH